MSKPSTYPYPYAYAPVAVDVDEMTQDITITMKFPSLRKVRAIAFLALVVFSVIVLGIAPALTQSNYPGAGDNAFGIACAVLTLVIPVVALAREQTRLDTFTSWSAFEVSWLFVTMVFWLTNAALSTQYSRWTCNGLCFRWWSQGRPSCSSFSRTICRELQTVALFSYFNFLILLFLLIWTLVIVIRAHKKGDKSVWKTPAFAYVGRAIYLDQPSPAFNASDATLAKGKSIDVEQPQQQQQQERPRTPSPILTI